VGELQKRPTTMKTEDEEKWTCDRCGSFDVQQEVATMVKMNDYEELPLGQLPEIDNLHATGYYYCGICQDDCSPIRAYMNSVLTNNETTN
jgi:hypothetical protein